MLANGVKCSRRLEYRPELQKKFVPDKGALLRNMVCRLRLKDFQSGDDLMLQASCYPGLGVV